LSGPPPVPQTLRSSSTRIGRLMSATPEGALPGDRWCGAGRTIASARDVPRRDSVTPAQRNAACEHSDDSDRSGPNTVAHAAKAVKAPRPRARPGPTATAGCRQLNYGDERWRIARRHRSLENNLEVVAPALSAKNRTERCQSQMRQAPSAMTRQPARRRWQRSTSSQAASDVEARDGLECSASTARLPDQSRRPPTAGRAGPIHRWTTCHRSGRSRAAALSSDIRSSALVSSLARSWSGPRTREIAGGCGGSVVAKLRDTRPGSRRTRAAAQRCPAIGRWRRRFRPSFRGGTTRDRLEARLEPRRVVLHGHENERPDSGCWVSAGDGRVAQPWRRDNRRSHLCFGKRHDRQR
jgi:hypothetical protein